MSRIFMDVGAHLGETATVALDQRYQFDRVCCFEPSKEPVSVLSQLACHHKRLEVYPFGLSGNTRKEKLYDPGSLSASIFNSGIDNSETVYPHETILLVDIFDWMRKETTANDFIVLKLNCEGGEVEIIDRLLESSTIDIFYTILITFDIREFPGGISEERRLRRLLRSLKRPNFCFSEDIMIGRTHEARLEKWLNTFGVNRLGSTKQELQVELRGVFEWYGNRSGRFARFESICKRVVRFQKLPNSVKRVFRYFKMLFRLNRDRTP